MLSAYIGAGLLFMLVPGTLLGVMNLLQISGRESVSLVSQGWLQAHGHAQVFGWIGSFILGIGFYSIPKLRAGSKPALVAGWTCWAMWIAGVSLRWFANVYDVQWRALLPISATLELAAFLVFFRSVSQHRPAGERRGPEPWIWVVISGAIGLMVTLVANLALSVWLSLRGASPAIPHGLDQRFLVLIAWGFLAPFIWGFSTRWMPVFIGLRPTRPALLGAGLVANITGVILTVAGWGGLGTGLFVLGSLLVIVALRLFEPAMRAPKTRGVHPSFPIFVRLAYVWLLVAGMLSVAAALWDSSGGIWGASRHAFTVGFVSTMVFAVGQRVLPAFAGSRPLWSPQLMLGGLLLLTAGCLLRVSAEVIAYQDYAAWAWSVLPVSAVLELAAMTAFAVNLFATFLLDPIAIP
jgi:uncharacterized protein involved in response to NO